MGRFAQTVEKLQKEGGLNNVGIQGGSEIRGDGGRTAAGEDPSSVSFADTVPRGKGNAVDWLGNREEYSMRSITYIGGGVNINGI